VIRVSEYLLRLLASRSGEQISVWWRVLIEVPTQRLDEYFALRYQ